jgi:hypothetical protein
MPWISHLRLYRQNLFYIFGTTDASYLVVTSVVDLQDPYVFGPPDLEPSFFVWVRIWMLPLTFNKHKNKKVRKTSTTVFCDFFFDFLSDAKQKNVKKTIFLSASCQLVTKKAGSGSAAVAGSLSQWYGSPDLDPFQNVSNPQHWF